MVLPSLAAPPAAYSFGSKIFRPISQISGFREGRPWTKESVHSYCIHHDIRWPVPMPTSVKAPDRREDDGLYSIRGVAAEFGVSVHVVRYWVTLGWIQPATGRGRGRPSWFDLDEATRSRLQDAPRNLKNSGPHRRAPTASLPET